MKKFSISVIFICFIILFSLSLIGCNDSSKKSSKLQTKSSSDFPVAMTIDKLTSESDIIVVGSYNKFINNWNMARHPEDFNKEDPNIYVKGALYEFNIEEFLKGNNIDKKTITVNVAVSNPGGSVDERYIEPVIGEKVILFLKKSPIADRYFGTMEPYQFSIPDTSNKSYSSDRIKVKTNLKQVQQSFEGGKSFTLDEFKNKINKAK